MAALNILDQPLLTVRHPRTGTMWRLPRVLPGPMEGVMRGTLCRAAADLDLIPGWIAPFIRISENVPRLGKLNHHLTEFLGRGLPVIVQLMGTNPELLAKAANRLLELDIAGIDVNFACTSGVVVRHGGGGGMLRRPELMAAILTTLRRECPGLSLSAKIRTGFADPAEMRTIIPALCATGIDFLTVHYRTVRELYRPTPGREERLSTAVALAGATPVYGSGDVYNPADAQIICGACGCAGVMAARGWLRQPDLLRRLRGQSIASGDPRRRLLRRMAELAAAEPGKYFSKPAFLEAAVFMFGAPDPFFRGLVSREGTDFLSFAAAAE
ncbi:MAG: tRNA-dihydrouridine synthase family protein [Victivallales bacterium]|nr:tRNA-dihydrouridine synthase family protein [Victivallales bacterium]